MKILFFLIATYKHWMNEWNELYYEWCGVKEETIHETFLFTANRTHFINFFFLQRRDTDE